MSIDHQVLHQILSDGLSTMDLTLTSEQQQKLIDYVARIHKWNKAFNLTSVRDPEQMMVKHILDSLAVAPHIDGENLIDVGTGPGLPGIPLSIVYPEKHFTLLDSLGKRVRFMKQCAFEMKLDNITPIQRHGCTCTSCTVWDEKETRPQGHGHWVPDYPFNKFLGIWSRHLSQHSLL